MTVVNVCKQCGIKPLAYPGAVYCGAGCTARAEAHQTPYEEGVQALLALQGLKGIAESRRQALQDWTNMDAETRQITMQAYKTFFVRPKEKEKENEATRDKRRTR